jgi:hypothetical protein
MAETLFRDGDRERAPDGVDGWLTLSLHGLR